MFPFGEHSLFVCKNNGQTRHHCGVFAIVLSFVSFVECAGIDIDRRGERDKLNDTYFETGKCVVWRGDARVRGRS